jgi:hypothetical protein
MGFMPHIKDALHCGDIRKDRQYPQGSHRLVYH